jgi:hypothetical protein
MLDTDVKLPWDDVLLPWATKNDPEAARIIERVQAKGRGMPQIPSQRLGNHVLLDDLDPDDVVEPSELCDDTLPLDGRSRRKRYANRAEQQAAYRARKATALLID